MARGAGRGFKGGRPPLLTLAGDRPATLQPQQDFPINRGGLCSKGWTATTLLDHPQRLLTDTVGAPRAWRPDQRVSRRLLG